MGTFRFMHSKHIDDVVEKGSLRFGDLRYYRLMELAERDQWIGDRNEGVVVTNVVGPMRLEPGQGDDVLAVLREKGVIDSSKVVIQAGGSIRIAEHIDCFILSMSTGDLDTLTAAMCAPDRAKYAYDGCVEILDVNTLCDRIWAGTVSSMGDRPVSEVFRQIDAGSVVCEDNEQDARGATMSVTPFRKTPFYRAQSEFRLALYPVKPLHDDYVTISFQPKGLFEVRFRNHPIPAKAHGKRESTDRSDEELFAVLNEVADFPSLNIPPWWEFFGPYALPSAEYLQCCDRARDSYETAFRERFYDRIVDAYWTLRHRDSTKYKWERMDLRILRFRGSFPMQCDLQKYLQRISARKR